MRKETAAKSVIGYAQNFAWIIIAYVLSPAVAYGSADLSLDDLSLEDWRVTEVMLQLARHSSQLLPSEPSCAMVPSRADETNGVSIGDAFVGALRREGEDGHPLRITMSCYPVNDSSVLECRFGVTAPGSIVESNSGFSFEVESSTFRVNLSSVRCFMTP